MSDLTPSSPLFVLWFRWTPTGPWQPERDENERVYVHEGHPYNTGDAEAFALALGIGMGDVRVVRYGPAETT